MNCLAAQMVWTLFPTPNVWFEQRAKAMADDDDDDNACQETIS